MMQDNSVAEREGLSAEIRYKHVWEFYRHMIDWRYRLMTRVLGSWAAIMIMCGWLWTNQLSRFAFIPCLVGAVASFVAMRMERRTAAIIGDCEQEGATIERHSGNQGLFSRLVNTGDKPAPYDVILPLLYRYAAVVWVAVTPIFLVFSK
jgi:hypothetical protein